MSTDDPRKIFLSHKSSDKPRVLDFKKTLEKFGYEVWLDVEAMPAGTLLERGLLQGMQDSCAVVFFITPSFEDEGYLQAEVNYAIQEKRKRGDQFAIITLLLRGDDEKTAPIPELLKPYRWVTPDTELEALREIDRAVSTVLENIEQRDEIAETAMESEVISPVVELPEEAVEILLEAANDDGRIKHIRDWLGTHKIETDHKLLVSSRQDEEVALWMNVLAGLEGCGYIERVEHTRNGTHYEITREGYAAADEMLET